MPTATITSKGQITIPVEVRRKLGLKAGDKIEFYEEEAGKFNFHAKSDSLADLKGILKKMGYAQQGNAPTVEDLDDDIMDYLAESDETTLTMAKAGIEGEDAA